jgi:hypothetical protein
MACKPTSVLAMNSEATRLAELIERLKATYPTLPPDIVVQVVDDMRDAFHGSRIREYVPLFVERRARSALTELAV